MPATTRSRNRPDELANTPQVSASDAKNSFGRMLDRVAREGALAITKHDEPCAVLISIEKYRALAGEKEPQLDTLSAEFDMLFERMQKPGAAAAMEKAFAMSPAALGRAAVKQATAGKPVVATSGKRRIAAKRVARARG